MAAGGADTTYSQNPLSPLMIPTFPPDATIASIHMACIRVGRLPNVMPSVREIYGISGMSGTISHGLGYKAAAFVERALASTIEPSELIRRHSMFPFLSSVMTKEAADRWCQDLASGAYSYQQHPPATRPCTKVMTSLRQCPECVCEDIDNFGTGHWRVLHQLPAVRFCNRHGHLLHNQCADCGTLICASWVWRLPGDSCHRCGSRQTRSTLSDASSPGYKSFIATIERVFKNKAPELRSDIRPLMLQRFIAAQNMDASALLSRFLSWWEVDDLSGIQDLLRSPLHQKNVLRLFSESIAPVSIPFLIAVSAFAWARTSDADRVKLLLRGTF